MSWALQGIAGLLKDMTFPLKTGMTLGRQGEVVVNDAKASSIHARITQSQHGNWLLQDNSSKNGTRIEGEKITAATLTLGLVFYIGDQGFEVVDIPEKIPDAAKGKKQRYWYDVMASFLNDRKEKFTDRKRPLSPLEPAVVLDFVRGIQANSRWTVGYGPRKIGPMSLDLPIWEPGAPAICFELIPGTDGVVFKTTNPTIVTLNGQPVDSQVLHVGDTIRILETIIEVDFSE